MPQNEYIKKSIKKFGKRLDEDERQRKKEARMPHITSKKAKKLGIYSPILIVPMEYRQIFFTLLSLYINDITVLAQEEIGCLYRIESLGEI
jgi:flagellar biosynthesis component FlhA